MSPDYGPKEKISDTSVVNLDSHLLPSLDRAVGSTSTLDENDLALSGDFSANQNCSRVFRPDPVAITTTISFLSIVPESRKLGRAAKAVALEGSTSNPSRLATLSMAL